jgi:hypothetical protein
VDVAAEETAEVTVLAVLDTVPVAVVTTPATAPAVPETDETREPPRPVGAWTAAEAGAASRRPMPNIRHRLLTAAPKMYKSTFRAGPHQLFMLGTLVTQNTNVHAGITI